MMSAVVLTEGGADIGVGHLRRCVTLAVALRESGVECRFRVRGDASAHQFVTRRGFEAEAVPEFRIVTGADAVVMDSYRLDPALLTMPVPTIVVDDLADRPLPVSVILNPTAGAESFVYSARSDTRFLLGIRYALLRSEFAASPTREIRSSIERIMITLGGSDHGTLACDLVRWTRARVPDATIDVVAGPFFRRLDDLQGVARNDRRVNVIPTPEDMREIMLRCDVAISSGGQTLYELAATGTPAVVVTTADNQRYNVASLVAAGTIVSMEKTDGALADALNRIAAPVARAAMSERGRALVDGRGAERAAQAIAAVMTTVSGERR